MPTATCRGVTAMEMETGEVSIFHAKATIFATGGGSHLYSSTNAFINTGDGVGMAARAPASRSKTWSSGSSTRPASPAPAC